MKPEPSLCIGCELRGLRRGVFSSWVTLEKQSSSVGFSLASFFFVTSMITTLGAMISKHFGERAVQLMNDILAGIGGGRWDGRGGSGFRLG